jgi:hypothetical protein
MAKTHNLAKKQKAPLKNTGDPLDKRRKPAKISTGSRKEEPSRPAGVRSAEPVK